MKRISFLLIISLMTISLFACSDVDHQKELRENMWNVVASNGEAYTAEFAEDTATFKAGEVMTIGMGYKVDGDEITLIEEDTNEKHTFIIEKNKQEYNFKAKTDDVKERFGDLTLSPINEK